MKIFILEDDDHRVKQFRRKLLGHEVDRAATFQEAVRLLVNNDYDCLFLDHDLGGQVFVSTEEENTGSSVARWLRDHPYRMKPHCNIFLHSLNPQGRANMKSLLPNAIEAPFAWQSIELEND